MSEPEAILLAAIIAAVASIFVGLLANSGTKEQESKTTNTHRDKILAQREQIIWEARRNLLKSFRLAVKECQILHENNHTQDLYSERRAAINKLEDLYSQMAFEVPESNDILLISRCLIEHFKEINSVASTYAEERDPSLAKIWHTRLHDEISDLKHTMRQMQQAVHKEFRGDG
ncbi:hypothetical protein Q7689_03755 [Nocardiopsis tropica]|uniref:hypothetical protein n=1 Tax=Nocardiopsis tropica TaxID=109330 RepID=UPI002E86EFC1|nr:hypothetical protein [Nocardiopsis tropica]